MLLRGVGAVPTASAAVPPLASTASATVGPSHFRAADPPGHRHSRWCGGLQGWAWASVLFKRTFRSLRSLGV